MTGLFENANRLGLSLRAALLVPPALALAACAGDQITATNTKKSGIFDKPDWAVSSWESGAKRASGEVKPEDLVDANGLCAGMAPPPPPPAVSMSQSFTSEGPAANPGSDPGPATAPQGGGLPTVSGGVALEMTECQVIRRAGFADRVEIGVNERNERAVTLTIMRGERPGIYRFVSGRLVSIERGPEPPPQPKPVKPAKPAKKPQTAKRAKQAPPANAVQSAPLRPPTQITVGR